MDALSAHYNLVRGLHILSVIAFMAGMLYLPRLFVYHTKAAPGSEMDETFKVMERRLLRGIINPASIATAVFGILLIGIDSQDPALDGHQAGRPGWSLWLARLPVGLAQEVRTRRKCPFGKVLADHQRDPIRAGDCHRSVGDDEVHAGLAGRRRLTGRLPRGLHPNRF